MGGYNRADNAGPRKKAKNCVQGGEDGTGMRSVERTFAVIDALASELRPRGLSDLARTTGLAKSTVHRILRFLRAYRLIAKSGDGYILGNRLTNLSRAANSEPSDFDEKSLMPFLMSLYDTTHAVVTLAVLDGRHAVHLEKIFNHESADIAPQEAYRSTASLTPAGKVLLAYQPSSNRYPTIANGAEAIVPASQLQSELAEVRRTGLAYSKTTDIAQQTVSCAATPVLGAEEDPVRAFSVTGVFSKNDEAKALLALRQNARAASLYLRRNTARLAPAAG